MGIVSLLGKSMGGILSSAKAKKYWNFRTPSLVVTIGPNYPKL
jgi:hypothetical protein